MLPTRLKPLAVWLYTSTVTAPALSPTNGPDRLVWSVGNGTVSVVPPVRPVARACPTSTPSPTKFTTGNPAPRFAKPFPLIVKLPGAAARSVGLGVIAQTPQRVSFTVRPVRPTRSKPLAVWLYTSTITAPTLSPGKGPDRLV